MAGVSILSTFPSLVLRQERVSVCVAASSWDAPTDVSLLDPRASGSAPASSAASGKGAAAAKEVMHLEETSSRTCRVCCPNYRPFKQSLYQGSNSRGTLLAEFRRNCKMPVCPCKPCCYQTLYVADASSKQDIGFIREECFVVMPSFVIINAAGQTISQIHYETCCTGLLYDFFPAGAQCCGLAACCCLLPRPPFEFHLVNTSSGRAAERGDGAITTALPEGVKSEEGFVTLLVSFPENAPLTPTDRLLHLGAASLLTDIFHKAAPCNPSGLGDVGSLFCCSCSCLSCSSLLSCSCLSCDRLTGACRRCSCPSCACPSLARCRPCRCRCPRLQWGD